MTRATSSAPSQRMLRVGEQVRAALTSMLTRGEISDPVLDGTVISISEVRMSPDLKIATAFVMPIGNKDAETVVSALNRSAKYIRGKLTPSLRQMKYMPELRFRTDTSFDNFQKIDSLLRSPEVARDLDPTDETEE